MILEMMLAAALGPQGQAINCSSQANDLKMECARELCGPAGTNPTIFVPAGSLDGYTPPAEAVPEIERVASLMDSSTQTFKTSAEQYLNYLEQNITADLSPETFSGIRYLFAPYVSWRVEGQQIKAVTQFPAGTSQEIQAGVNEWARGSEERMQNDFPLRLRLGLATSEETVAKLKERLQKVLIAIDAPGVPAQIVQAKSSLLQNAAAFDRPAPPYEFLEALDQYLGKFENALGTAAPGVLPDFSAPAPGGNVYEPACREQCLKALRPFLTKTAMQKRIKETRERLESERAGALRACRAGMMLQAKYGQTQGGLEKAQELVETALTSIEKSPWMSTHTAQQFGGFIRNYVDIKPEFPSQLLAGDMAMQSFTQMAQQRLKTVPMMGDASEDAGPLFDLSTVDGNLYGRDFRGCPSPRHLATDFFWQGIDKPLIHVSPHSCRHHDQGVGTLAHELGHALSYFMSETTGASGESTRTYLARRECVAKLTPLLPVKLPDGAQATFSFDRLTTEEDMADWVMQQAVPFKQYPLTCDFLKLNDAGNDYDPALFDVTPKPDDTHSGGLLRIIREYHAKTNRLPANCQQLMNGYAGIVEAQKCE